jgi:hypothetical protein
VLLAVGVLAVLCLVLLMALVRIRSSARRTARELDSMRQRLDDLEQQSVVRPAARAATAPVEFVITDLGREQPTPALVRLDAPAFADIVLKETVVKAASLAHGVRRGLAPATRNRIRFEMKQEVRRARKQRRADLKAAQRDLQARERAGLSEEAS